MKSEKNILDAYDMLRREEEGLIAERSRLRDELWTIQTRIDKDILAVPEFEKLQLQQRYLERELQRIEQQIYEVKMKRHFLQYARLLLLVKQKNNKGGGQKP